MALDVRTLEKSVREQSGLMQKLGDCGRFLTGFIGGGEISERSVKRTIGELQKYVATCFEQIDEIGQDWDKTDRQLMNLRTKLKEATRAGKKTLRSKADVLLRKTDGFEGAIDKLKTNGIAAEVLMEKLRDLLILISGPMSEGKIDQWTTELESAIDEREMGDEALDELQKVGQRASVREIQTPSEETDRQLEALANPEASLKEVDEVDRRLDELFED